MASVKYQTRQGDSLDYVCWKHYGRQSGAVEQVLAVNPGLAELGVIYPENITIVLPELAVVKTENTINIWD
ncbi:tail protein X [Thalassomonas haliotis]|uniref:Tail protein X n=1 Tax=Thalassomonas haliotis TaxID=485448 RepID=A0ABY7VE14_9GAMM|nr:tail protein X [Thalassomonas haliotis]WDE11138.1 tail protein X [Thalassomonas haliotis]